MTELNIARVLALGFIVLTCIPYCKADWEADGFSGMWPILLLVISPAIIIGYSFLLYKLSFGEILLSPLLYLFRTVFRIFSLALFSPVILYGGLISALYIHKLFSSK